MSKNEIDFIIELTTKIQNYEVGSLIHAYRFGENKSLINKSFVKRVYLRIHKIIKL